ncbi:redoxin [Chitinophaga skermanii]|uniref:Redoxin n=1 Tax=Chitinophaga skermanii TaxID=331697 RepID=A0A327Q984_9BACT|nr:redoxin family protein [Chitinophaga skermanii]RAJ00495.1 redoxin [Chitinophaga skermanii]
MIKRSLTTVEKAALTAIVVLLMMSSKSMAQRTVATKAFSDTIMLIVKTPYQKIQLFYQDAFGDPKMLIVNPAFKATDTFYLRSPKPFIIKQADVTQIPYLLCPGDTVSFQFNQDKYPLVRHLTRYARTCELNFFRSLYQYRLPQSTPAAYTNQAEKEVALAKDNMDAYQQYLNDQLSADSSFFVQYVKARPVTPYFHSFLRWYMLSNLLEKKIRSYFSIIRQRSTYNVAALDSEIVARYQEVKAFPYMVPNTMMLPYETLMNQFLTYKRFRTENNFQHLYEVSNNITPAAAKSYVQFMLLKQYFSTLDEGNIKSKIGGIANTPSLYRSYLQDLSANGDIGKKEENMFRTTTGDVISLDSLLRRFPGKMLYVNFYTSDCSACISELITSRNNKKQVDTSKIVFLQVSMDKDKATWQQKYNENKNYFTAKNTFLLIGNVNAPLAVKNKIITTPRAILINKDGVIIDNDAPASNNSRFVAYIQKARG